MIIPEVVFIQLSSWRWAHSCSKHVEDSNKCIIEEIVRQVGYLPESLKIISAVLKYLHACRRTDKVMDGSFSVGPRRYFKRISKAAWSRPAGKMMHSVGQDNTSLSGCMSTGLIEYEAGVLITQPRRRNLLKLTPLGYAVPSDDLERLWNGQHCLCYCPLRISSETGERSEKPYWR